MFICQFVEIVQISLKNQNPYDTFTTHKYTNFSG
jgi:hypothetical protein